MSVIIRQLIITVKANEERQPAVTQLRPQERGQAQQQGQDALIREAVDQTLEILSKEKER